MIPSPTEISYFIEVASTLNLSRAAERLGISQPTITLAMQRLENSVGAPLFIRSKRGVTLTNAGKHLNTQARELLQKWEALRQSALSSDLLIQGTFKIGAHPTVALYSLCNVLPSLLKSYPQLKIELVHDLSRKILEQVIQMKIDIGVVVNPVRHPDLIIQTLCKDEVTLWAANDKSVLNLYKEGRSTLIADPELLQTQAILNKLKKQKINFNSALYSSNLEVIAKLTSNKGGIGILPERAALSHPQYALIKIPGAPIIHDEICLAYRVENKKIRSVQLILQRIASALKS